MSYDAEDLERLDAERGYSERGEREVRLREWFSLRDENGAGPKEFEKVVNRLRVKKWVKENPERRQAIALRYARKPESKARQRELGVKRRRARWIAAKSHVTCAGCGVEFCSVVAARGNVGRKFCTDNCQARTAYRAKHPGAKQRGVRVQ